MSANSLVRVETTKYNIGCQHNGKHHEFQIQCTEINCDVWHCWNDITHHFNINEDKHVEIKKSLFQSNTLFKCILHGFKSMPIVSSISKKSSYDDEEYKPSSRIKTRKYGKKKHHKKVNSTSNKQPKSFSSNDSNINVNRNPKFSSFHDHEAKIDLDKLYLSKHEILSLQPEQLIDHKRMDGKWCQAKIQTIDAQNNCFIIEYVNTKQNVVIETDNDSNFVHKFAIFTSISGRQIMKPHTIKTFKLGYDKFQVNGEQCKVIGMDDTSGQLKVKNIYNSEEFWIHPDDETNVKILQNLDGLKIEKVNVNNNSQRKRKRKIKNIKHENIEAIVISSSDDDEIQILYVSPVNSPPKKKRKINQNEMNIKDERNKNECKIDNENNEGINMKEEYFGNNNNARPYQQWEAQEIICWLTELENGRFKRYETCLLNAFKQENVTGEDLKIIREKHLEKWGVDTFRDYVAIHSYIQNLVKGC
eukprot:441915_1